MASSERNRNGTRLVETAVGADEAVSLAVLRAVAAVEDVPIVELPPLYRAIDPDALCELLEDRRFDGTVSFRYSGHPVVVSGDMTIEIYDEG